MAIQTHLQEHPTHLIDPDIEFLDKASSNFIKSDLTKNFTSSLTHKPELNSQYAAAYKRKHNKDMFKSIKTRIVFEFLIFVFL